MSIAIEKLPDDVAALKKIITEKHSAIIARDDEIEKERTTIKSLREQIALLKKELFGRRSEKLSSEDEHQGRLFNEAEAHSAGEAKVSTTRVKAHSRKKRGRKPLSADLPRIEKIYDIKEEEKTCKCGADLTRIGQETSEELEIIPERVFVRQNIRYKYACKSCEGVEAEGEPPVKTAPMPPRLIPKSIASAGMIAYVLAAKFCDALPFYRVEKIFARWGVDLKRATMCNWAIFVARRCEKLLELMLEQICHGNLTGIDETTVQVLKKPDREDKTKSFMWVIRGGPPDKPVILYQYRETRRAKFLIEFLSGFKGVMQTDGYEAYESVAESLNAVLAGCMDHARRKFNEALIASEGKSRSARSVMRLFRRLYYTEKIARKNKLSPEELLELRQKKSARRMRAFKKWLDKKSIEVPPGISLGKAISYTLNQWPKLKVFLDKPEVPISNILVENAIRPFVIGRKNWLFSGSPRGAKASAAIYSLIETAKANNLEPYWYLRYLFDRLPEADSDADYRALLPGSLKTDTIREYFHRSDD